MSFSRSGSSHSTITLPTKNLRCTSCLYSGSSILRVQFQRDSCHSPAHVNHGSTHKLNIARKVKNIALDIVGGLDFGTGTLTRHILFEIRKQISHTPTCAFALHL